MPDIDQVLNAIVDLPEQTYAPNEDSFLMLEVLSKFDLRGSKVLDLGTGSGILGLYCAKRGAHLTVTDIHSTILDGVSSAAKKLGVELKMIKSDMFLAVEGKYNLVLFNPPYLPSIGFNDNTTDGGHQGRRFINKFFEGLEVHLERGGSALILVSSLNNPQSIIREHPEYSITIAGRRALFFEELQVLLCRFRDFTS